MDDKNKLSAPAPKPLVTVGIVVGMIVGCIAIFMLPNVSIILGALLPMVGAVLGACVAQMLGAAFTRK